ncbi:hypothetical protein KSS87_007329 [Heliosperma pusillum]|nr:hypothetical protein KSS87_007329 [Heliosperma pusillum]
MTFPVPPQWLTFLVFRSPQAVVFAIVRFELGFGVKLPHPLILALEFPQSEGNGYVLPSIEAIGLLSSEIETTATIAANTTHMILALLIIIVAIFIPVQRATFGPIMSVIGEPIGHIGKLSKSILAKLGQTNTTVSEQTSFDIDIYIKLSLHLELKVAIVGNLGITVVTEMNGYVFTYRHKCSVKLNHYLGLRKVIRPCMGADACPLAEGQGSWCPDARGVGDQSRGDRTTAVTKAFQPLTVKSVSSSHLAIVLLPWY